MADPLAKLSLSGPYLNPEGLIVSSLPDLLVGDGTTESVSRAGNILRHFHGSLAPWRGAFREEVLNFYSTGLADPLRRCSHLPVYMSPANRAAMTTELVQVGAEITLSGRFVQNALMPVMHIAKILTDEEYGPVEKSIPLPKGVTFGDSWIVEKTSRIDGQQPDLVMKLRLPGEQVVRLIGELKSCVTVPLGFMFEELEKNSKYEQTVRGILGQVVHYMLGHGTKFGFLSNYRETVFLTLDHRKENGKDMPCIFYSDVIRHGDTVDLDCKRISLRLAMLYLVAKASQKDDRLWKLSPEERDLTKEWIVEMKSTSIGISTPMSQQQWRHQDSGIPVTEFSSPVPLMRSQGEMVHGKAEDDLNSPYLPTTKRLLPKFGTSAFSNVPSRQADARAQPRPSQDLQGLNIATRGLADAQGGSRDKRLDVKGLTHIFEQLDVSQNPTHETTPVAGRTRSYTAKKKQQESQPSDVEGE